MTILRNTFTAILLFCTFSLALAADPPKKPVEYPSIPDQPAKNGADPKKVPGKPAPSIEHAKPAPAIEHSKPATTEKPVQAPDPELALKVGDKAPALTVGDWIQGKPIKAFAKDKVYVLEFWASWCGPCMASIPHVNEMQEKFKDAVTIIGVNVMEDNPDEADKAIKKLENKPKYRLVRDDKQGSESGKMVENWLAAAGQDGIPTTIIVDQAGMVAWIGHPMEMEKPLQSIIDKTWDLRKARTDFLAAIVKAKELQKLQETLGTAIERKNFDKISATIDQIAKIDPQSVAKPLMMKFSVLFEMQEFEKAFAIGEKILTEYKDDYEALNEIAWDILNEENKIPKRDYPLAMKLALRANKVAKGERCDVLDTLAHAYFYTGDIDKAIATGKKAVEKVDPKDKEVLEELKGNVKMYEEKKGK